MSRTDKKKTRTKKTPAAKRTGDYAAAAHTDGRPKTVPSRGPGEAPDKQEMWALVYDSVEDKWDQSKGFRKALVPRPYLDEATDPLDARAAILKLKYTGFCGSDAGIWFRTSFKRMIHESLKAENKTTRIIGHEVLGEIVDIGSVTAAHYGYHVGETVAAESHIVCGRCHQCLIGAYHVCTNENIIGITRDGGFAEYIKLPAEVLWRTDTSKIRPEVAAIQEPFGNAVHACTATDLRGKRLAVFGCGAIGQFTILIARALGASRIVGVEPNPHNAGLAKRLGADEVIQFKPEKNGWKADQDVVEAVREFSGSDGVDVCMEMAGYNSSVNNVFQSVRRGGDVVLFGLQSGDFTVQDFSRLIVKGITIRNVIGRRIFDTWEITKNLLEFRENQIQEKIYNDILNKGNGTIVNFRNFDPVDFEQRIKAHPKMLIEW